MTNEMRSQIMAENKSTIEDMENSGHKLILLGLGGSYAYGTNVEDSDIDVRGVYLNSIDELLGVHPDKEQYVTQDVDTTVYSLKKAVWLLKECNPAMIEMLACRDEDYAEVSPEGRMLIKNMPLFLSKKATKTFGGYARSQLNRFVNRSGRSKDCIAENEERSFEKAFMSLASRHKNYIPNSASIRRESDNLFLSFQVQDMPVSEVSNLLSEFNSIDKSYRKSTRNDKAIKRGKLSKHMMHLIRLYMMGIELMNEHEVHTYRSGSEHSLLMSIRNGDYLEADNVTPTPEFEQLVNFYSAKYEAACEATTLPDEPDMDAINRFLIDINRSLV